MKTLYLVLMIMEMIESGPDVDFLEIMELSCVVEAEAGNQGELGKAYVCDVVLNRVDSDDFPNTIHDVIFQRNQFSTAKLVGVIEPSMETYKVVFKELRSREDYDILYFRTGHYHVYGKPKFAYKEHYFSMDY